MQPEERTGVQNTLWWITSIAIAVVCCSVLFILFASYLVELKADIKDDAMRINAVEEREDRILVEVEAINKRIGATAAVPVSSAASPIIEAPTASTGTLTSVPVEPPASDAANVTVPVTSPTPGPAVTVPAVAVPDSAALPTATPAVGAASSVPSTISVAPSPASTVPTIPAPAQP